MARCTAMWRVAGDTDAPLRRISHGSPRVEPTLASQQLPSSQGELSEWDGSTLQWKLTLWPKSTAMILPVTENGGWITRNIYQADDLQGVEKPAHCGTLRKNSDLRFTACALEHTAKNLCTVPSSANTTPQASTLLLRPVPSSMAS